MSKWRHLKRQRGIFLVELMAMLVVIAAILLLTAQIAATSARAAADASKMDTIVTKMDQMIVVLRKDIWTSAAMHAAADAGGAVTLELDEGDGRSTRWQFVPPPPASPASESAPEAFTVMRTSAGGVVRMWQELPGVAVHVEGPLVKMEVTGISRHPAPGTGSRDEAVERMTFVSERQMAGGGR